MSNVIPSREGCAVIDDGYTRPAYLAGVPYTTPAVRFTYRPPLIKDLSLIRREMSKAMAAVLPTIQAQAIAKYVCGWSVTDSRGDAVPLRQDALAKVDPYIFDGVTQIILGLRATDVDPDWAKTESEEESARNLSEVFGDERDQYIATAEEGDAKNS